MKVKVDKDTCIGCGACQAICSDVFEYGDDGIMDVKAETVPNEYEDDGMDAKYGCPVDAIKIEEN